MKIQIWIFKFILASTMLAWAAQGLKAQTGTISGTVTIQESGETLPGVNVVVKGTSRGTFTDKNGNYEIRAESADTLVFSAVGFTSKQIRVAGQTTINVTLEESVSQLSEMVVIGYGEQSRATLTTSISKVDTSVLKNVPYTNVSSALQGSVSGLRVQTTSGQPGSSPQIVLRGGTSINSPDGASPLYIVDGVKRGNLNDLSPNNIKSIQVLKDAASTAIYGARASNGVVIVETKDGAQGKIQINYTSTVQANRLGNYYELGSAREYIKYGRLGIAATGEKHPERLSRLDLANGLEPETI